MVEARASSSYLINYMIGVPIILVAVGYIYTGYTQPAILIASIFFVLICTTDMLLCKIPNLFNLGLLLAGFVYNFQIFGIKGLAWAFLGTLTGFILFILPYAAGGMGAGDVKALAALGALSGPIGIFHIFLYTALIGGCLAILYYSFTSDFWKKSLAGINALRTFIYTKDIQSFKPEPGRKRQGFPYAAAIALGFFAFVQWGPIINIPL